MVQRRRGARLAQQPGAGLLVPGVFRRNHFDCDIALQSAIVCAVDDAHAPGAELLRDGVGAETFADHRNHSLNGRGAPRRCPMIVRLVNPANHTFGTSTITPRWLFVLAGATPREYGDPVLVDETLERLDVGSITRGEVVGISIHTGNALRGYEIGRAARERGAWVIFGGAHATLYPEECHEAGGAHAVVKGDGDVIWPQVLGDAARGTLARVYDGGRVPAERFARARWDLLPVGRYLVPSVQTVRGCPKHCSFCSVWRTDGQEPRQRPQDAVLDEIVELRRRGFRFVFFADDNFYPVTRDDLREEARRPKGMDLAAAQAIRDERLELLERLAALPGDMMFFTQITMEAAEDEAFLEAMQRARIGAVLVGIESVSSGGLKAIRKSFNSTGDALVERLQAFRRHGVLVLGSFIFGLPGEDAEVATATLAVADRAQLPFGQFVMLSPYPDRWISRCGRSRSARRAWTGFRCRATG